MRQTKLHMRPQPKAGASPVASQITTLLSQYELLSLLCEHLSSADIVHLGATSKEHHKYIASSPVIFKALLSGAACDGRGIVAQARVFGHWKADPANATRKCRGKDAKPCDDCGAMVCNMCRYHLSYPTRDLEDAYCDTDFGESVEREEWDMEWDLDEQVIGEDVNDAAIVAADVTREVELAKAISMLTLKDQTHCEDCDPIFAAQTSWEWISCSCTVYTRFVQPWRCIPCVLAEETKLVASQQKYTMIYDPAEYKENNRSWIYERMHFCKCGKRVLEEPTQACRWCIGITGYYCHRDSWRLERIYAQLGTSTDDRSNDPILSQLG